MTLPVATCDVSWARCLIYFQPHNYASPLDTRAFQNNHYRQSQNSIVWAKPFQKPAVTLGGVYSRSSSRSGKRRQYDTFLKNKHFARDVLVDLHLNLALFAFPPCKNLDFLILFVKTSHPRRLPNRSIPRKTLPEFEFWLIECIHKLLASSSPLKKAAGTRVLGTSMDSDRRVRITCKTEGIRAAS